MENIKNTANETANNLAKKTYDVTVVLESSVENEDKTGTIPKIHQRSI